MARTRLDLVLYDLQRAISDSKNYVLKMEQLKQAGSLTRREYEKNVAQAFLDCFMSWETFLSESFVLYLVWKKTPSGYGPQLLSRFTLKRLAYDAIKGRRRFFPWNSPDEVIIAAEKFFVNGDPYKSILGATKVILKELIPIRNRIPHSSKESRAAFEKLARDKLSVLTTGLTPGSFLTMTVPHSNPPISFYEYYTESIPKIGILLMP